MPPRLAKRPKGSSPNRGEKNWICFYCKFAPRVALAPDEKDDPKAMAALGWSDGFEPPSVVQLYKFWRGEHQRTASEYAERKKEKKRLWEEHGQNAVENEVVSMMKSQEGVGRREWGVGVGSWRFKKVGFLLGVLGCCRVSAVVFGSFFCGLL